METPVNHSKVVGKDPMCKSLTFSDLNSPLDTINISSSDKSSASDNSLIGPTKHRDVGTPESALEKVVTDPVRAASNTSSSSTKKAQSVYSYNKRGAANKQNCECDYTLTEKRIKQEK